MTDAVATDANGSQTAAGNGGGAGVAGGDAAATSAQSGAQTTTGQQNGNGQGAQGGKPAATGADPFAGLKAPEGFDAAAMPKLVEVAKSYGLNAENAQRLLNDTHTRQVQAKADADTAAAKGKADNIEALKADKDFGGDKFAPNMQRMQQAVDKIDARIPGVKAMMGRIPEHDPDYPIAVRMFALLGEQGREDSFAAGGDNAAGQKPPTLVNLLYPKS